MRVALVRIAPLLIACEYVPMADGALSLCTGCLFISFLRRSP